MKEKKSFVIIILTLSAVLLLAMIYVTGNTDLQVSSMNTNNIPLLIIDAGHGGEDGGAVASDGTPEKEINLEIAMQTQALASLFGIDCIMTRTEDADLADHSLTTIRKRKMSDINARMAIMESNPQATYIGIHQNLYEAPNINGLQVFYSTNHADSKEVATAIQNYTKAILQPTNNRKTKAAGDNIYLLYHTQNPAVMVECGFISNPQEYELLRSQTYGTQIALCIVGGIIEHYNGERIT